MLKKRAVVFVIVAAILAGLMIGIYIMDRSSPIKNVERTAFTAVTKEVRPDYHKNIYILRTMYDENQNRFWIEFYDTKSYPSILWLGFVVIDARSFDVLYTATDITLYSGLYPEMVAGFRKSENELHNEHGDFYS